MQLNTLDDTTQELLQEVLLLVRNVLEIAGERLQRSPDVGFGDGGELLLAFRLDLELRGMLRQLLSFPLQRFNRAQQGLRFVGLRQ